MKKEEKLKEVLALIGHVSNAARREISGISNSYSVPIEEIRLRVGGLCTVRVGGQEYPLNSSLDKGMMNEILTSLCAGALYAHRDSISEGYISMDCGVRVGVAGRAGYEGGSCVGIGDVGTLVFRLPTAECGFAHELYDYWLSVGMGGMLIISPPACGKTTALRSLAAIIGSQRPIYRTVAVDERCEFDVSDFSGTTVDILRGYKRSEGIEIAVRTMSPDIIMCDEIYRQSDVDALMSALGAGVTVIATAHGRSKEDVINKHVIKPLIDAGMFRTVVTIRRENGDFVYTVGSFK
jgi:stage III sporulation protein AA